MPKRKADATKASSADIKTPAKRARASSPAGDNAGQSTPDVHNAITPQTGEKRGRGRPRKNPEAATPKAVNDGAKRGRGRPKKVLTEAEAAAAAAKAATSSAGPKKGRGRPRKEPGTETPSATPKKKDGRGRPRKSLPANDEPSIFDAKADPDEETTTGPIPNHATGRSYWLMKAEPESRLEKGVDVKFSIDDLAAAKEPEPWDGVRNAVARNLMRDMKKGDYALFYHSNCKTPGVVGAMEIVQEHSTDESAFDPKHPYYDPKSKRDDPKWSVVHVEFRRKFNKQVTLHDLKANAEPGKPLKNLQTIKQSRLSVSSVTPAQWRFILELAGEDPDADLNAPGTEKDTDAEKESDEESNAEK
ncbi:High mobility group HMG-I/HMG-Y [Penicillium argentinense]|uniref:Thymocyte nuclear protein 1 n=1 Tax=Penicillium argentinense TaxID=1131581 RepID=A0A9W9EZ00_9EURO|nr:High mobility group HMG-I/HMG-Y [Penicillium argentinense]KAJ5090604.1 High mobility group HMG-I/HMG-Y [Penicillium argentinense]